METDSTIRDIWQVSKNVLYHVEYLDYRLTMTMLAMAGNDCQCSIQCNANANGNVQCCLLGFSAQRRQPKCTD